MGRRCGEENWGDRSEGLGGCVRRCKVVESLESEKENLVVNAIFDREPVELLKHRGDMIYRDGSILNRYVLCFVMFWNFVREIIPKTSCLLKSFVRRLKRILPQFSTAFPWSILKKNGSKVEAKEICWRLVPSIGQAKNARSYLYNAAILLNIVSLNPNPDDIIKVIFQTLARSFQSLRRDYTTVFTRWAVLLMRLSSMCKSCGIPL